MRSRAIITVWYGTLEQLSPTYKQRVVNRALLFPVILLLHKACRELFGRGPLLRLASPLCGFSQKNIFAEIYSRSDVSSEWMGEANEIFFAGVGPLEKLFPRRRLGTAWRAVSPCLARHMTDISNDTTHKMIIGDCSSIRTECCSFVKQRTTSFSY